MGEQLVLSEKSRIKDGSLKSASKEPLDDQEVEEEDVEEDSDDDEEANIVTVVKLLFFGDSPTNGSNKVAIVANHCQ